MPRRLLCLTALVILVDLISASVGFADDEFRVSSYIPDRFHDFQWLVSGETGTTGSSSTTSFDSPALRPNRNDDEWTEDNSYRLDVFSTARYRLQTLDRILDLTARLNARASESDRDEIVNARELPVYDFHVREQSDENNYEARLDATVDVDQYLISNLFIQGNGRVTFRFRETSASIDEYSADLILDTVYQSIYEQVQKDESEIEITSKNHVLEGMLLLGWGRQYQGEYGATALFIVDRLRRDGLLVEPPDYDQMQGLARLVHTCREALVVDSRYHRIESLDNIIGYLTDIGAIEDPGPYGHLLIQDVWDYYPVYQREFGWRVAAGVGGRQTRNSYGERTSESSSYHYQRRYIDGSGVIDTLADSSSSVEYSHYDRHVGHTDYVTCIAEYNWPASLNWQLSCEGFARASINRPQIRDDRPDYYHTYERRIYNVGVRADTRYIFDARTDAAMSLVVEHDYEKHEQHWDYYVGTPKQSSERRIDKIWAWTTRLAGSLRYRIAVPTTLRVYLSVDWVKQSRDTVSRPGRSDQFNYYLSTSIEHYIF